MPVVHVHMLGGRTPEQKRRLVAAITRALVEEAGAKPEAVTIVLHDTDPSNWAEGGSLLAERKV
jgi:4-oxalocrotonate tautomerase